MRILNDKRQQLDLIFNFRNRKIEKNANSFYKTFTFECVSGQSRHLIEENIIIIDDVDEFIIKEVVDNGNFVSVLCLSNFDSLEGNNFQKFESVEQTAAAAVMLALAGSGWSVNSSNSTKLRTIKRTNENSLDILNQIKDTYRCFIKFNSLSKTIDIIDEIGSDSGTYFMEDLNLVALEINRSSYNFFTRMIARGRDGIEVVVTNNSYSDKTKTTVWKDERYTKIESLREDAQAKLDAMSRPVISYVVKVVDLASMNPEYSALKYDLYDLVYVVSKTRGIKEKMKIVKCVNYLENPELNSCELGNNMYTFNDMQSNVLETVDTVNNITIDNGTINGVSVVNIDGSNIINGSIDSGAIKDGAITSIKVGELDASKITAGDIDANRIKSAVIEAINASIGTINSDKVVVGDIDAGNITSGTIDAGRIKAGSITGDKIAAGAIAAGSSIIADAAIGSAQISNLSASKIAAGIINAAIVEIAGENGRLRVKNNTITVNDGTQDRAVFGLLGENKYGLQIKNGSGSVLVDENGITQGGWTDGYNKQANNSVDPGKLDINKVVTNINGATTKILGTSVTVGDGILESKITSIEDSLTDINNELVNLGQIYTIILDRLVFPIPTSQAFIPVSDMTLVTKVRVFDSVSEITDFTLSQSYRNKGIDISFDNTNKTVTANIKAGREIEESATLDINITIKNSTFSRTLSFVSIPQGADGAPARVASIIKNGEMFYTEDGGTTYKPDTISLTPVLQEVTFGKWQYSTNYTNWTDVTSGQNGLTIVNNVLTIKNDSDLFSNVNTVGFKLITGDSNVYDISNVSKLFVMSDDIYKNIKTNTSSIKQLEDEIVLKVTKDDYTQDQQGVVARFERAESSIKANADKIDLSVTKAEFNNVTMGGRNLLQNSTFNNGAWSTNVNYSVLDAESDKPQSKICRTDSTPTAVTNSNLVAPTRWYAKYKTGDTLAISFDYRPANDRARTTNANIGGIHYFTTQTGGTQQSLVNITHTLSGFTLPLTLNTWYRAKYVYTFTSDVEGWFVFSLFRQTAANVRLIQDWREINVENSFKVRDWTPAPEDFDVRISSAEIKLEPGKITQAVSETLNDGSGSIVTATYEFTKDGGRYKHTDSSTYTDLNSEGMGVFNNDGSMVASYKKVANIPSVYSNYIKTNNLDCPSVYKVSNVSATLYVAPGGTGDRSGRDDQNACTSVMQAMRIFLQGSDNAMLNQNLAIQLADGIYEGAQHAIDLKGILGGSGELLIKLSQNTEYKSRIIIENCLKRIVIWSTASISSDTVGGRLYPGWWTPCITVINSPNVIVQGVHMIHGSTGDHIEKCGIRVSDGSNVKIEDCDFYNMYIGVHTEGTGCSAWISNCRGSSVGMLALGDGLGTIGVSGARPDVGGAYMRNELTTFKILDGSKYQTKSVSSPPVTSKTLTATYYPTNIYSVKNYTEFGIFYQSAWTEGATYGYYTGVASFGNLISNFVSGGNNSSATVSFTVEGGGYGTSGSRGIFMTTSVGTVGTNIGTVTKGNSFTFNIPSGALLNHILSGGDFMIHSKDQNQYLKIIPSSIRIDVTTTKTV